MYVGLPQSCDNAKDYNGNAFEKQGICFHSPIFPRFTQSMSVEGDNQTAKKAIDQ